MTIKKQKIDSSLEPVVYVVDDDEAVRDALYWLLDSMSMPCRTFASAREFLDAYEPDRPGCLIADVRMPQMSGLDLQAEMAERGVNVSMIMISGHGDVQMAVRAMKGGAVDFIQKPFNDQEFLDLVQRVVKESIDEHDARAARADIHRRMGMLTLRERQVLDRIVAGDPNKRIAAFLGRSEKTVEFHRARLMEKMQARSLAGLMKMVVETEAYKGRS